MSEFFVWAPHADSVALIFTGTLDPVNAVNATDVGTEPPRAISEMIRGDDGVWRVDAEAFDGDRYLFRVRRGDEHWDRIDPRAREVTNSIGCSVYRDPVASPSRSFVVRPREEMVIYELHLGTFGGDFDGVLVHLDALVDLGVNAVEVLPVAEFAGDLSWGYNPALPFAVESSYGGPQAFHRFVEGCHVRGLSVILDVVFNHLGPSDLDLWRFDGWGEDDGGGIYFYNDWRAETPWGATRPDYGRDEVRGYLLDNARMWLSEFQVDGLRLDSTVNIRNAHGHSGPDGDLEDGWSFLCELTETLHREFPGRLLIAEDLQSDPRVTLPTAEGGLGFDAQWAGGFVHPVRRALIALNDEDRDLDEVSAAISAPEGFGRVLYTESHDEVANGSTRVPAEINESDPHSVVSLQRSALGAVLVMTSLGIPMIFQGQEWGDEDWFDDRNALRWERRQERSQTVSMWRDLIALRSGKDKRTLGLMGDQVSVDRPVDGILVVRRWGLGGPDASTIVVMNFTNRPQEGVPFTAITDNRWECLFSSNAYIAEDPGKNEAVLLDDGRCNVGAYGALIFGQ